MLSLHPKHKIAKSTKWVCENGKNPNSYNEIYKKLKCHKRLKLNLIRAFLGEAQKWREEREAMEEERRHEVENHKKEGKRGLKGHV